jgi:hypothetical protein
LVQPCLTFQHAHDTVAAGGEIDILDHADYGPIYITKALSIVGGGIASVLQPNPVAAITINAGDNDKIFLSGLSINGLGVGQGGIVVNHAFEVMIVNCVVRNMRGDGITVQNVTNTRLLITDTLLTDNGFGSGIALSPNYWLHATLNRVTANSNLNGLTLYGAAAPAGTTILVSATNSIFSNNDYGVATYGQGMLSLMNVTVTGNGVSGLIADASGNVGGTMSIGRSLVAGNSYGATVNSTSTIFTQGDNAFRDNINGKVQLTGGAWTSYTLD